MKKVLVVLSMAILLVGCSSNKSYDQSMQKAKEAIVEKEFEKAEGFIELALENKKNDGSAKKYQQQLTRFIDGNTKKESNIAEALLDFEAVIKIEDGSSLLVKYAKEEIKSVSDKANSSNEEKEVKQEKDDHQDDIKQESTSLWSEDKDAKLNDFMTSWGSTMNQQYKKYDEQHSVDLYGIQVPNIVLTNKWTMAVGENPVSVEWSTNGAGSKDYQLVAVYSDADTQPYLQKHVYFFVFHNNQPKVLVTQQNQGNPNDYLYFNETESADLKDGFINIIEGKTAVVSQAKENAASGLDWESIAKSKVTSQFPEYEVSHFEDAGDNKKNVFIKDLESGHVASHAVGTIDTATGETFGF